MTTPSSYGGGGFMPPNTFIPPQSLASPSVDPRAPSALRAIGALSPRLFRAASEQRAIYGSTYEVILANLLGKLSFGASSSFRIRGHNGNAMPLGLFIRFVGAPLSGKTDAHDRFNAPVIEAMKGWGKRWLLDNLTRPGLLRKIRGGAVLLMLSMAEGRTHLDDRMSRAFSEFNDLYDGHVPAFDRAADDDDELILSAPDSAIFIQCVNVHHDKHREWLDKNAREAIGSGYLYRLLISVAEDTALEGAGKQQPEVALLDYDQRMVELIAGGRIKLTTGSAKQLPIIDVMPEAEQILRHAIERFESIAAPFLPPTDARVFAVRLATNARRIAGCMHVFEGYGGGVSADTVTRSVAIAEYFELSWLCSVFPPKRPTDAMLNGERLLGQLHVRAREERMWFPSWRKSDLVAEAPNFGWTEREMKAAITFICGHGFAQIVSRAENGRRVIKLELVQNSCPPWPINQNWLPASI
jgi:hypothetical protein